MNKGGELRHVIQFEVPPGSDDAARLPSGGVDPDADWPVFATLRAKIESLGGTEQFGAAQFNPESMFRMTIRYYPGLTTAMRIRFGTRLFDVISLSDYDERHKFIIVLAREGKAHGVLQ